MEESANEFNDIPHAKWCEKALSELVNLPVKSVCMFAILDNGDIYNNYTENITMGDKLVMAGIIQQDAMLDTMIANGFIEEDVDGKEEE